MLGYDMLFVGKPWRQFRISGREGSERGGNEWDEVKREDIWLRLGWRMGGCWLGVKLLIVKECMRKRGVEWEGAW